MTAPLNLAMKAEHWCVPGAILLAGFIVAGLVFAGFNPVGHGRKPASAAAFIPDGSVILLRSGTTNAAVVVTRQGAGARWDGTRLQIVGPEGTLDYTWFLRADGKTTFHQPDPGITTGSVTGAPRIVCGPFIVDWSTAGSDGGFVYHPANPYPRFVKLPLIGYVDVPFTGTEMALIDYQEITNVDAGDPRWKWRRR